MNQLTIRKLLLWFLNRNCANDIRGDDDSGRRRQKDAGAIKTYRRRDTDVLLYASHRTHLG